MFHLNFKTTLAALSLLAGFASPSMALMIDSFDQTAQSVIADGASTVNAPEALGGVRSIRINKSGPLGASSTVLIPSGVYTQSSDALTSAVATLNWNVSGGVDLTDGLVNPEFVLDILSIDYIENIGIEIAVMDTDGDYDNVSVSIPTSMSFPNILTLPFSAFDPLIDFKRIESIFLTVSTGDSVDLYLDRFRIRGEAPANGTVPEPSSIGLLTLGAFMIGWIRRRGVPRS